jgi:hypothetical protein
METKKRPKVRVSAGRPLAIAPGQALGYSLQYTRLTAMLLSAEQGSYCGLEVVDDVSEAKASGSSHLVQTKSALGANPVADRAQSLWKTLGNWVRAVRSGLVDPDKTLFEIYVSRPVRGDIVDLLSAAKTEVEALAAITEARSILWGPAPGLELRPKLSPEIAPFVNEVLASDESVLVAIVKNFQLTCGSGSPQTDIEAVIGSHPVSPSKVSDIADHMCGVVKRQVDVLLEKALPAILSRDEFHALYTAYCRRVDRETILKSSARRPTEAERVARLPDVFVRQLELIELEFEDQLGAVSDYLMACADRTDWARAGDVDSTSFEELDAVLTRAWKNRMGPGRVEHKMKADVEIGQLLYFACMEFQTTLQAMETPAHFIPGCFHRLADVPMLGWHPAFQLLLESKALSKESA